MKTDFDAMFFGEEKAQLHDRLIDAATTHREWMREHSGDYIKAVENYSNIGWLHDAIDTFRTVFERIAEFGAGEEPEYKATFILGQAERSMASIFSQTAVISEYQDHKEAIEQAQSLLAECREEEETE